MHDQLDRPVALSKPLNEDASGVDSPESARVV